MKNTMYRYLQWLSPLGLLLAVWLGVSTLACAPAQEQGGVDSPCNSPADCQEGLRCLGRKCREPKPNEAPVAKVAIVPTDNVQTGEVVTIDGSRSSDPNDDLLEYVWTIKGPNGSKAAAKQKDARRTTFTPDLAGRYIVTLVVKDGKLSSKPASRALDVAESPNQAPIANAGPDQAVKPGSKATLDGSGSLDPDGPKGGLTYAWELKNKPQSSQATLVDGESVKPSFVADVAGRYILSLIVTDERGKASVADSVTVIADPNVDRVPVLDSLTPAEGTAELDITLDIKGKEFVAGAKLQLSSKDSGAVKVYETKYLSDKGLSVPLSLKGMTAGAYQIRIVNPNQKASAFKDFAIKEIPTPSVTTLTPEQAATGAKIKIQVKGENFMPQSEILFRVVPLRTTFKSATLLEAELDLSQTIEGNYDVLVRSPGNRTSNVLKFKVIKPGIPPKLNLLNPPFAVENSKIPFSVHGVGFDVGAVIIFDGKPIPSKRIRRDEVDASPVLDLTGLKAGKYKVWVKNYDGQESNKVEFRIEEVDPTPVLDRILPFNVYLDEKNKLAIYGQSFRKGARLFIGTTEVKGVMFRSDSYLEATLDGTKPGWKVGDYNTYVQSATGKKSGTFKITVTYRTPSMSNLSPNGWNKGCDTEVFVNGLNFVPASKLYFGTQLYEANPKDAKYKLTYISDKQLKFKVYKSQLNGGTVQVYVVNGPGAQTSKTNFYVNTNTAITSIQSVRPSTGAANTLVDVEIYADTKGGNRFYPGAVAYFEGKAQQTNCLFNTFGNYCTSLRAKIDLNGFKPGSYKLSVIPACGKTGSSPVSFLVSEPPQPYFSRFTPSFAKVGDKQRIVIRGVNFAKKHTLTWNGKAVSTVYRSDTEIQTKDPIDFSASKAGEVTVVLDNGSNRKATGTFSVLAAKPTLSLVTLSKTELQRGQSYGPLDLAGSGFTKNSKLLWDGKPLAATFRSSALMQIPKFDLSSAAAKSSYLQVIDGTAKSNKLIFLIAPVPAPTINYLSITSAQVGQSSKIRLYIYGTRICKSAPRCLTLPKVEIKGSDGKDYSSRYSVSYAYNYPGRGYMYGDFNLQGLQAGSYTFRIVLPTGEKSNPAVFSLVPPPPPSATGISPPWSYRGVPSQPVNVVGANFATGDFIVLDNNILKKIPGTSIAGSSLSFVLDTSVYRYAGKHSLYVLRCLDKACTKNYKTKPVTFDLFDPPCGKHPDGAVDCATQVAPNKTEACYSSAPKPAEQVCRPTCKTTADCTKLLGAPKTATCKAGLCL